MALQLRRKLNISQARLSLWICFILQIIGDLAIIYIAYTVTNPNFDFSIVPTWQSAVISALAMLGLLFAISCPMVVMRILRRVTDSPWMRLALCLATIALSAIWPVACATLVG